MSERQRERGILVRMCVYPYTSISVCICIYVRIMRNKLDDNFCKCVTTHAYIAAWRGVCICICICIYVCIMRNKLNDNFCMCVTTHAYIVCMKGNRYDYMYDMCDTLQVLPHRDLLPAKETHQLLKDLLATNVWHVWHLAANVWHAWHPAGSTPRAAAACLTHTAYNVCSIVCMHTIIITYHN